MNNIGNTVVAFKSTKNSKSNFINEGQEASITKQCNYEGETWVVCQYDFEENKEVKTIEYGWSLLGEVVKLI